MRYATVLNARVPKPLDTLWAWSLSGVLLLFDLPRIEVIDFVTFWVGAKLVIAGETSRLYSLPDYRRSLCELVGGHCAPANRMREFAYPPHILLWVTVFGLFPLRAACALWTSAGAASLLAVLRRIRFRTIDWRMGALALLSPACVINFAVGQNGAFTGAFFLGGFFLSETSPVAAGVLFGLLTVKPHLGILVLPALLIRRNWRCIAAAAFTGLTLAGLSVLFWGPEIWEGFFQLQLRHQVSYLALNHEEYAYQLYMPGPYADLAFVLGLPGAAAWGPFAVIAAGAFIVSLLAVKREGLTARSILMLAIATMIVLPYAFTNDMVMVAGALLIYVAGLSEIALPLYLLLGLLWALPVLVAVFKHFHLPVSALILAGTLACLGRESHAGAQPSSAAKEA